MAVCAACQQGTGAAGNGCNLPAVAIGVLVLCAGGYVCSLPAWNGCRVPAGAIDALVVLCWWLWMQGNGCSLPAVAIVVLVVLCAGALWVQGTDAAGQLVLLTR